MPLEALWREGLHIINENYATTQELDRAIEDGPGLRYSIMGTFLTFHLAGGNAGMKHMLKQFGPAGPNCFNICFIPALPPAR